MARFFLWQKSSSLRGMHYVDWDTICSPTRLSGLWFHCAGKWQDPFESLCFKSSYTPRG
ncbi:hypothetical protein KSP40_PGU001021 [Platanthera guangdongensis]|uniref:Uncharacterized protein n=1 Tax=Platanthera guangdongensis TaxID=2320717 RepID=A0ABR2M417_9ASPA